MEEPVWNHAVFSKNREGLLNQEVARAFSLVYWRKPKRICRMSTGLPGHVLMENRNGLIVDAMVTQADGTAERDAGLLLLYRKWRKNRRWGPRGPISVGADKAYGTHDFVTTLRAVGVLPNVAQNLKEPGAIRCVTTPQAKVMAGTQSRPPDGSSHWSCRKLAKHLSLSKNTPGSVPFRQRLSRKLLRYIRAYSKDGRPWVDKFSR